MNTLKIEYTDKEITAYGGLALLKKMLDKMSFEQLLEALPLPAPGSNRGYDPAQIITQFIISIWCGANRFEHLEVTRFDGVIQQLFGWKRMAGHRSFIRFFEKFDQERSQEVFTPFYQWFFDNLKFDNFTLDLDSSVITRYGQQEAARVGYNPRKPGRKSPHPLMAFIADVQMVANFWLRSGNAHTANNFEAFLEDTLQNLQGKQIGLLRADTGFYDKKTFLLLENRPKPINYIIGCPLYISIQRHIESRKRWLGIEDGIEKCDSSYQSPSWNVARRLVIVRQKISKRPKAPGKQLKIFEMDEIINGYRYSCYVTNLNLPAAEIWRLYRGRAVCENQIKELKHDYGADKINLNNFDATHATLSFIMMAYNLMSLFKQAVIKKDVAPSLKTIRYTTLNVGSYMVQNGRNKILKMSLHMKRRSWITRLWNQMDNIKSPFLSIQNDP